MKEITDTQSRILDQGKIHFMREGYKSSSLRQIVKDAGFTLGAFYGYYTSKEELFAAIVGETALRVSEIFSRMFGYLGKYSSDFIRSHDEDYDIVDLVALSFNHSDELYLLFKLANGTRYENFLDVICEENKHFVSEKYGLDADAYYVNVIIKGYLAMVSDVLLSSKSEAEKVECIENVNETILGGLSLRHSS